MWIERELSIIIIAGTCHSLSKYILDMELIFSCYRLNPCHGRAIVIQFSTSRSVYMCEIHVEVSVTAKSWEGNGAHRTEEVDSTAGKFWS